MITHLAQSPKLDRRLFSNFTSIFWTAGSPLSLLSFLPTQSGSSPKNNLIYFTLSLSLSLSISRSPCVSFCLLFVLMNDFWDKELLWWGHRGPQNHITVNDNKKNNLRWTTWMFPFSPPVWTGCFICYCFQCVTHEKPMKLKCILNIVLCFDVSIVYWRKKGCSDNKKKKVYSGAPSG